jgi:hypothetical protein
MDIEEQRQQPDCAREPGALTQPAISEAPQVWQPIETAPKDGTRVLLFGYASTWGGGDNLKQPIIRCGRAETVDVGTMVAVDGSDLFRQVTKQIVRWVDDQTYLTDDRLRPPTHWMPLPSAPGSGRVRDASAKADTADSQKSGALTQPAISEADVPDGYMHPTVPACLSKDPLAYQGAIPLFRKQAEQKGGEA